MENPIIPIFEDSYEEAKRKAKEFYDTIGQVYCPSLKGYVHFNRAGFQHLIRRKGVARPKSEQMRRFALLAYAEKIIINPDANPAQTTKEATNAKSTIWVFHGKHDDLLITLALRQVENGNKHFFSIYGKKQKSAS